MGRELTFWNKSTRSVKDMDLLKKFFQMIVNEVKGKRANIFLKIYPSCHGSPMEEATVRWETHRHDFQRASGPQPAWLLGDPGIITPPL